MAGYTSQVGALADGSIKAKTGSMATYAKDTMANIYQELSNLHADLQADIAKVSTWQGADKEAFNNMLNRFQAMFEDIGKTLRIFSDFTAKAADEYASLQATNVSDFDNTTYTPVSDD